MFAVSSVFMLLFGVVAVLSPAEGLIEVYSSNPKNASCGFSETDCRTGCCPFSNGVCCAGQFECCPEGQVCIPQAGMCIGLKKKSLFSTKTTSLRSIVSQCPAFMTECGPDRCCPLYQAVCCSDGVHCCPFGYACDLPHQRCIRSSDNYTSGEKEVVPLDRTTKKSAYKSCPGGIRQCPWYSSCCLNNQGNWGCCPDPSTSLYKKGIGECCDTTSGYTCCPDSLPHCSYFLGCT